MKTAKPKLILIPGLLCDSTVWKHAVEILGASFETQVANLTTQNSLTKMAQDILNDHDGPLLVAGHSMGARVAIEVVRLAPERVLKLALLDTGIHPLKEGELEKRQEIIDFCNKNGMDALSRRWLPPMLHPDIQKEGPLLNELDEMVKRMNPEIHERQITALINRPNARDVLPSINCPTMIIVGRQDVWSPVSQHEEMHQLIKNSELSIIEDAGHFAPIEKPDEVSGLLEKWAISM